MRFQVALLFAVGVTLAIAAEVADKKSDGKQKPATDEERPKIFRRYIPADVLRDFPGMCFASTRCATIEPGQSWELSPYCGRSTCIKGEEQGQLIEIVEDCGPLPKPNNKCKLSEKTNNTASFPECCPVFDCEPGVKLEYPEIPKAPENAPPSSSTPAKPKA